MNPEPRFLGDYSQRQVKAARRVLVDLGQVLASWKDCIVVVGGWTPDLLILDAEERHVGSIDVDLVMDVEKLTDGRYADVLKALINTRRYRQGEKSFQLTIMVDLGDGGPPIQVDVDFLSPRQARFGRKKHRHLDGFRILQADGCGAAFRTPVTLDLPGQNVRGDQNTVQVRVASLADFLIMKAHAINGRDKPKDSYDLCYCLDYVPGGMEALATEWQSRTGESDVAQAIGILKEKFASVDSFGPRQVVEFYSSPDPETQSIQARRAYELVNRFLSLI